MKITTKRRVGVSSSKISAILNRNKYRSVEEQFLLDMKRKKAEFSETSRQKMAMGHKIEPVIKETVEEHFGIYLTVDKNRYCHDDYEFCTIEFDALDYHNQVVYEFKNTEMDEEHIRETYYAQVQYAMFIIGWDKARICYLRNGWDLGYIEIYRDDNFIENMVQASILYWTHLREGVEPNPEDFDEIASRIKFYQARDKNINKMEDADLSEEDLENLYEWAKLKRKIDHLKIEEERYKGMFIDKVGKYKDDKINYQNAEYTRKGQIDWKALQKDHPDIDIEKYRKPETTYTRQTLRYKFDKDDEENVKIKQKEDIV